MNPLLLCFDGSPNSRGAVETAGRLFAGRRAVVLHVWQRWTGEGDVMADVSSSVRGMTSELDTIADDQSVTLVELGVEIAREAGLDAEPRSHAVRGPVWRGITEAAVELDAEAIILGNRGLGGISAALGSVSRAVVQHSRKPVLVVPLIEGRTG